MPTLPETFQAVERIREEVLPPLYQLVAEHERMKREIAAARAAEESSFSRTWFSWSARERAAMRLKEAELMACRRASGKEQS